MASAEPNWLNQQEKDAWTALTSVLTRLQPSLNSQIMRDSNITHFEYIVMSGLSDAPDRTMRMSDLAAAAGAGLPRLSQVISRLAKRGWVTRHADPGDARCVLATLTEAGWDKVVATAPGHVNEVRRLVFDHLTKAQVAQLATIGHRIAAAHDGK
ncbi:MarR family winged helix-turn-helix transcriptional regulator [Amycolatopsis pithecellobii]|uniref:MarR family transcriptional regulator n=1 Tax=Amycolatopsis pithecellobii TaxID=664692 RepID=A0A6N7Z012_9PSEU|nr:MarR family winged helix-turn-helix transcriptional regulator [Amycolatopsis pithecellobii]MTD53999.1 MarR family transcriptional regulator [Amycolatopsis pithecellobii]